MIRKKLIFALCTVVFSAQTACVANNVTRRCSVEGAELLGAGANPEQICNAFRSRLEQSLAAGGSEVEMGKLAITLTIDKRGTAQAQLTGADESGGAEYPPVAVDVMDRPLKQGDLDKLADEVARMLMSQ